MAEDGFDYEQEKSRYKAQTRGHSPFIVNGRPADLQPLPTIDPVAWHHQPIPDRRWIVPGLVPEGAVTMLGGDGGLGKSQLALQLLTACALGKSWLDIPVRQCRALGIFCEDDRDELQRRLADILHFYDASFADLENLTIACRVGQESLLMTFPDQWSAGEPSKFYAQIHHLIEQERPEIIVLDSLHDLFGGNENSRPHARQFVGLLRTLAVSAHGGLVLTAHPSLSGRNSGTGEAGSTAWNNAVRQRLYLTAPTHDGDDAENRDHRELKTMKANYSARGAVIRLRWRDGVFVREDRSSLSGIVDVLELDHALLTGLRTLIENGALVPADPKAPRGFANAVRELPACRRFDWNVVCAAQARLLEKGKIVRVEMGPPSKRRVYLRPADMTLPGETKEAK